MNELLLNFSIEKKLFSKNDRLLVAVSGGVDSRVLMHILSELSFDIGIAHCNFQLRGQESDMDEQFVALLAKEYEVPFYSARFSTAEFANEHGLSIQMAARQLRYEWFEKVRFDENYNYIAIAHNLNDTVETFFINLIRGTSIRGLTGMPVKNGYVVRPLMFAKRNEIVQYAKSNQLDFREDSSNAETKYLRNKIRHGLLPVLNEINRNFYLNIISTMERLDETSAIYQEKIQEYKKHLLINDGDTLNVNINELLSTPAPATVLYEILHPFNFSNKLTSEILSNINGEAGSVFYSSTHRVVRDRDKLLIALHEGVNNEIFYIPKEINLVESPFQVTLKEFEASGFIIPKQKNIASVDLQLLEFPLLLRKWHKGDSFQPFGMNGFKKLSDFFIDNKISLIEKEKVWIVESNGKIVWVVGYRIDNRFRITESTSKVLTMSIQS